MNHDITIGEMIDPADEQEMGLLGRDSEIQFVRLAAGYNKKRKELNDLRIGLAQVADELARIKEMLNLAPIATEQGGV